MTEICSGLDALGAGPVRLRFGATIESVEAVPAAAGMTWLTPGFIDLQVNGFAGVDFNAPEAPLEEVARAVQALFASGVTRFYPTVITGPPARMEGALRNIAAIRQCIPEGEAIAGFHVEGPHISPEEGPRGAHPERWVRRPDLHEFHRMQDAAGGHIRIVTLAPEWPEAPRFIEGLVREGVVAAIGHTNATAAQIAAAVSAGATLSTHLGNAAHRELPRHPNYLWEQLAEDRLMAGFIADGIHLGAAFLKVALRAKGTRRAFLITDAAMPAGCRPGRYTLGEQPVELTDEGWIVLAGGSRLAGSALRMDHAVGNIMRLAGLPLEDAIRLATLNPARAGSLPLRTVGLVPGGLGDVVEFRLHPETCRIEVLKTYVAGRLVYRAA
jgi:N-acetylglucosamine-6-phosphate deacetylase